MGINRGRTRPDQLAVRGAGDHLYQGGTKSPKDSSPSSESATWGELEVIFASNFQFKKFDQNFSYPSADELSLIYSTYLSAVLGQNTKEKNVGQKVEQVSAAMVRVFEEV